LYRFRDQNKHFLSESPGGTRSLPSLFAFANAKEPNINPRKPAWLVDQQSPERTPTGSLRAEIGGETAERPGRATDKKGSETLKYRCPAAEYGLECAGRKQCEALATVGTFGRTLRIQANQADLMRSMTAPVRRAA